MLEAKNVHRWQNLWCQCASLPPMTRSLAWAKCGWIIPIPLHTILSPFRLTRPPHTPTSAGSQPDCGALPVLGVLGSFLKPYQREATALQ